MKKTRPPRPRKRKARPASIGVEAKRKVGDLSSTVGTGPTVSPRPSNAVLERAKGQLGCRRDRPLAHPGGADLLWAIQGGRLVELHRDWAVIELAANGSRRVFERRRVDAGNVTLPWIEWGRRPGDV